MFIVSPRQLSRLVEKNQVKTITVDIFDTVLLRKIYPEDRQFLLHAKEAVVIIQNHLDVDIDPFYFYSLRKYCRSIIDDTKAWNGLEREARIQEIFGLLIETLTQKYEITLQSEEKQVIINELIEKELDIEKKNLRLNSPLVEALRSIKSQGIRVFFLSDMYLSCDHVKGLLDHFGASDVFDDGFCSSDFGYGKSRGKLFLHLKKENLIPGFYLINNLHVGDNEISDYRAPRILGVCAVHYRTLRNTFYRTTKFWWGVLMLRINQWGNNRRLQKKMNAYVKAKCAHFSKNQKVLYRFGFSIAPALLKYLDYVSLTSHITKEPIFFLSSEGKTFIELLEVLGKKDSVHTLDSFNRINLLRGYTYLHFIKSSVQHPEGKSTLDDFLKSIGVSRFDYGLTKLALHQLSLKELIQKLLQSEIGNKVMLESLNKSYDDLLKELNESGFLNYQKVIVADIGWGGTIQILLEQMLEFIKKDMSLRGVYFGLTGFNMFDLPRPYNMKGVIFENIYDEFARKALIEEIWENILTTKNTDDEKLMHIQSGIFDCFRYYRTGLQCTPADLFALYRNKIIKTFDNPSKREVMLLGSIEHDVGFGSNLSRPLVDMQHSKWKLYAIMFSSPRRFAKLYADQYWKQGFGVWYGMKRTLHTGTNVFLIIRRIFGTRKKK